MKVPIPKINLGAVTGKLKGIVPALRAKLPARLGGKPLDGPPAVDPYEGIPEHLRPTFFQRNAKMLPVWGAYLLLFLIVAGTATYLLLNEEAILAERKALQPVAQVSDFGVVEESAAPEAPSSEGEESPETNTGEAGAEAESAEAPPPVQDLGPDPYAGNLAPHPDPGLIEEVERLGTLPIIGEDNRVPWKVYGRPASSLETRPKVSIIVLNLGLSTTMTERAIRLPGPVTLSFSPYARGLNDWIQQARDAGHEVMIGVPMQPRDFPRSDAGLLQLQTTYEPEQNILNLQRVMSATSGYIGLVNDQGSGFTASRASLQPVMAEVAKRGLVYFDTLENATSAGPEMASDAGVPNATADLLIDQTMSRPTLVARLAKIELLATSQESAVIAVQPYPMLLDRVDAWSRDLGNKGLVLTPLSGLITARLRGS